MGSRIKVGSDFSGVGAFNQALMRLGVDFEEVFACDMDKYARQTFIHNYGEPAYYPTNVYERKIPSESLDIYMTSPPCQAFSLAGKRLGKDDKRGILFFNSLEFIQVNKPRYFIFENVKGLLSDNGGKTFSEWVNLLGGKSINSNVVLFPYEDAVPYHLYWQVLNAKEHGVPQNRERVFLIGIRDDADNNFRFPIEEALTKRLKDVLGDEVDTKYFLNEEKLLSISKWNSRQNPIRDNMYEGHEIASCLLARGDGNEHGGMKLLKIGYINQDTQASAVYSENGLSQTMTAGTHGYAMGYIQVKSGTAKGYEEATEGDSINFGFASSDSRRGRVGKGVAQTLDTGCQQAVIVHNIAEIVKLRKYDVDILKLQKCLKNHKNKSIKAIAKELNVPKTEVEHWFRIDKYFAIPNAEIWFDLKKCINITTTEFDASITEFIQKEGVFEKSNRVYDENGIAPTMTSTNADERILIGDYRTDEGFRWRADGNSPAIMAMMRDTWKENFTGQNPPIVSMDYKIRRLTPRECFRLMDFPDTFTWPVSDSQAYKQAGNSIVVNVLYKILKNLRLS